MISKRTRKRTSSLASVVGPTPSSSPDGLPTAPSGPAPARVSRSRQRGNDAAQPTLDISGLTGSDLSPSAALQRSLESRLRAALDVNGSPEYALTWKHWDMPSGLPICALRALGRRTSGTGYSGWPTPTRDDAGRVGNPVAAVMRVTNGKWERTTDQRLRTQVYLAGWPTPTVRDHKDGSAQSCQNVPDNALLGRVVHQFPASTEKRGVLNPAFSRWLIGLPAAWDACAPTETRSSRKSQRRL